MVECRGLRSCQREHHATKFDKSRNTTKILMYKKAKKNEIKKVVSDAKSKTYG